MSAAGWGNSNKSETLGSHHFPGKQNVVGFLRPSPQDLKASSFICLPIPTTHLLTMDIKGARRRQGWSRASLLEPEWSELSLAALRGSPRGEPAREPAGRRPWPRAEESARSRPFWKRWS